MSLELYVLSKTSVWRKKDEISKLKAETEPKI